MRDQIIQLRKVMKEHSIDAYFVPSGDYHNSEFVNAYFCCREYFSGLTGEAGELLVTDDGAWLWTDGRFFLQAEKQLAGSGIQLMRTGEPDVPTVEEFLENLAAEWREHECEHIDADAQSRICGNEANASELCSTVEGKDADSACGSFSRERVLGFDGRVVSAERGRKIERWMSEFGVRLVTDVDLAGEVWMDRPKLIPSGLFALPDASVGASASGKISAVREEMRNKGADYLLLSDLMETAWLFNLRGADIAYTPVFYSYTLISMESVKLFLMREASRLMREPSRLSAAGPEEKDRAFDDAPAPEELLQAAGACVEEYDSISAELSRLPSGSRLWLNGKQVNHSLMSCIPENVEVISDETPVALMKAVKNEAEIRSTLNAHRKDGIAMVRFLRWIKAQMSAYAGSGAPIAEQGEKHFAEQGEQHGDRLAAEHGNEITHGDRPGVKCGIPKGHGVECVLTEIDAAGYLDECRRKQEGCFDLSFPTIAGYGENGAIIHYAPTPETNAVLRPEGFLLVDSGGQYLDGTTDITRTIALGPLTDKMREHYTLVLKSHIAMASVSMDGSMTGKDVDRIARAPLNEAGLDFNHGISHGVGHVLGVHEGPYGIRKNAEDLPLWPGMIMSDEPGVYIENEYGIRIENEVLCISADDENDTGQDPDPQRTSKAPNSAGASLSSRSALQPQSTGASKSVGFQQSPQPAGSVQSSQALNSPQSSESVQSSQALNSPQPAGSVQSSQALNSPQSAGSRRFRTITFCPYEPEAILPELLTGSEKAWLNGYNEMIRKELLPELRMIDEQEGSDLADWLISQTEPVL